MRRAVLTMLALAVLLPSVALARTQFFCDIDRVVRDACCCPPKQVRQPLTSAPVTAPVTMRPECCKIEKRTAALVPIATEPTSRPAPPPTVVSVASTARLVAVRGDRVTVIPRAQAPPPERSLFSQYAALLL